MRFSPPFQEIFFSFLNFYSSGAPSSQLQQQQQLGTASRRSPEAESDRTPTNEASSPFATSGAENRHHYVPTVAASGRQDASSRETTDQNAPARQRSPAATAAAAASGFLPTAARNDELSSSEEPPPALNNGKSASTGLVRRSSALKTGEINLKKKLIIRRNSSRVGKEQNQHNLLPLWFFIEAARAFHSLFFLFFRPEVTRWKKKKIKVHLPSTFLWCAHSFFCCPSSNWESPLTPIKKSWPQDRRSSISNFDSSCFYFFFSIALKCNLFELRPNQTIIVIDPTTSLLPVVFPLSVCTIFPLSTLWRAFLVFLLCLIKNPALIRQPPM